MEIVKDIGAIIGAVLSAITLLALFCKPIRRKIMDSIKRTAKTKETTEQLNEMQRALEMLATSESTKKQALLSILRDGITRLYFAYIPEKSVPVHARKNMVSLFESYERLGGNSYIKTIYEEFMEWEVKT